jgi:hypothetical protein
VEVYRKKKKEKNRAVLARDKEFKGAGDWRSDGHVMI